MEVYQPKTLRSDEAVNKISALQPDFIVVAAYGKILPQAVLDIPRFGCVNLHGSLLPKYRGAAPIQWCVINGEKKTGVTTMRMDAGLDTGDILLTSETEIGENETAGELFDRLAAMCPPLLFKTLRGLEENSIVPVKQNESEVTYVGVLSKEMAALDWHEPAAVIHNKVRGLNPWPAAKTTFEGKLLKIYAGRAVPLAGKHACGSLIALNGEPVVACGDGRGYLLLEVQLEGAKRMPGAAFLRGHSVDGDCVLT